MKRLTATGVLVEVKDLLVNRVSMLELESAHLARENGKRIEQVRRLIEEKEILGRQLASAKQELKDQSEAFDADGWVQKRDVEDVEFNARSMFNGLMAKYGMKTRMGVNDTYAETFYAACIEAGIRVKA